MLCLGWVQKMKGTKKVKEDTLNLIISFFFFCENVLFRKINLSKLHSNLSAGYLGSFLEKKMLKKKRGLISRCLLKNLYFLVPFTNVFQKMDVVFPKINYCLRKGCGSYQEVGRLLMGSKLKSRVLSLFDTASENNSLDK